MAKKGPQLPTKQEFRTLPVKLPSAERPKASGELAALIDDLEALELKKKVSTATFATEIKQLSEKIRARARTIRTGIEDREICCELAYDFTAGKINVTRLDTKQLVESREMTDEERQLELDFDEGGQ